MKANLNTMYRVVKNFSEELKDTAEANDRLEKLGIPANRESESVVKKMLDEQKQEYLAAGGKRDVSRF